MPRKRSKRPFRSNVVVSSTDSESDDVVETDTDSEIEEFMDQLQRSEEALWDFLYRLKGSEDEEDEDHAVDNFGAYLEMFNAPFVLRDVLDQCRQYLTKERASFEILVANERVEVEGVQFVHAQSIAAKNSSARTTVNRRISVLPKDVSIGFSACPYHAKGYCKLVEENVAFVCYLQSIGIQRNAINLEEDLELKKPSPDREDEHEKIVREERVNDEAIFNNHLQALPSFNIDGKEYVFLHDIRVLFDLREDSALEILAHSMVQDPILGCLETKFDLHQEFQLCFDEARRHEKKLPTEEKFRKVQAHIPSPQLPSKKPKDMQGSGDEGQELEDSLMPKRVMHNKPRISRGSKDVKQSIDLWMDKSSIYGNNFQMDGFLGRRSGKRESKGLGKDASLSHYLKGLVSKGVLVFHPRFSNNSYIPILAFKTLSSFLGGNTIPSSIGRIILVEKQVAIYVFGYAEEFMSCRAAYFSSYTAYALMLGIRDVTPKT